jgi:hypothetical protein
MRGKLRTGPAKIPMPVPFLPWIPRLIGQRFMAARNYWPRELRDLVAQGGFTVRNVSFVLAILELYPWLPASLIGLYRRAMPRLEKTPFLHKLFAVSVLIIGQKPNE